MSSVYASRTRQAALLVALLMLLSVSVVSTKPASADEPLGTAASGHRSAAHSQPATAQRGKPNSKFMFSGAPRSSPAFCGYSAHSVAELSEFSWLLRRQVDCAVVFNDAASSWRGWELPWYVVHGDANYNWAKWKKAKRGRQLILTQAPAPSNVKNDRWLARGAAGQYNGHARALARNLVAAGLGSSYVRLGHEMNGDWNYWSVPDSSRGQAQWRGLWRQLVTAMRSVPGAHFKFVWNVNYQVRKLSLKSFYPGDRYVDDIGLDAYDAGVKVANPRFRSLYKQRGGIADVMSFARSHRKTMSFPEWGLWPRSNYGGGDDPGYISGMAKLIRTKNVSFAGYWYAHKDTQRLLQSSSRSLALLRHHFGSGGYSLVRRAR